MHLYHKGENGESYWEEEEFKWRGIKTFQDNWDLDTQNLSDMIKRSLHGVSHMMVSQQRFPERRGNSLFCAEYDIS